MKESLFFFLFIFALTFHKCQIVMKAILSFFDFWSIFWLFFLFLFIFALTFDKCQIVMKAILSFLFFAFFLKVCWAPRCSFFRWAFCVRFCLCFLFFSGFFGFLATTEGGREGQRLMTADGGADYRGGKGLWQRTGGLFCVRFGFLFSFFFMKAILSLFENLMTADGGLITGAGKAYDSGRGVFLCAFLFVFSLLLGLLLLCCGVCCGVVVVWLLWLLCGCCGGCGGGCCGGCCGGLLWWLLWWLYFLKE